MSFRDFLDKMDEQRQVLHVKEQVSTRFEISHMMEEFDDEGPLLLFEKVKGCKTNVAANVCGRRERVCAALRVRPDCLYSRVIDSWRSPRKTKVASDGLVKQNARKNVDLSRIPFLTHFEKDAGAYVTSGVVHARDPDCKIENISVHRLQVLDKTHLAIRLVPRHLFKLWRMAKESSKDLDVAVSVGVHPAVLLAASSPVPFGVSEFDVANNLLSGSLRLIECEHVNALAPADSELVLECKISTEKDVEEGPFVDISGTYDVKRK